MSELGIKKVNSIIIFELQPATVVEWLELRTTNILYRSPILYD